VKTTHRIAYALVERWWALTRPYTLGVRVMLVREGEVVLVRHTYRKNWYFPGGGVNRGESLEDAARREAHEEVGATIGKLELVGAHTLLEKGRADHVVTFLGRDFELSGQKDWEIEEVSFFPVADPPADASPGTLRRLEELRAGRLPSFGRW
jgi:8-oxo-dGTP pyrophosphatase MutT (NUDIX family)